MNIDKVKLYSGRVHLYIELRRTDGSVSTVEGAERDLALWARARTLDPLTDPEWAVVSHALRQYVVSDAKRGGTKLVEHVEVVEQVRGRLTVEVEYSDREAVRFECFRENGCTRSTHNWERGDGWPAVTEGTLDLFHLEVVAPPSVTIGLALRSPGHVDHFNQEAV